MTSVTQQTKNLRELSRQRTAEVLNQPGSTQRFAPSPLATINPAFARTTSFLPSSVPNQLAGSFQQQRAPGANYLNYETMAPNVAGSLSKPTPPAGYVPLGTQPETIRVYPDGTPVPDIVEEDDSNTNALTERQQEYLDRINQQREAQGLDPYETIQEYVMDQIGPIGRAEGGIASIQPMYMAGGGIMGALSSIGSGIGGALSGIGSGIGRGIEALGGLAQQASANYQANQRKQEKRLEDMTREELLEYIKSGKKPSGGLGADLKAIGSGITDIVKGRPIGGTAALGEMGDLSMLGYAGGGDVDFPRMNGPISGPGTETSDDIPAMLSDGEFVVNAKAVRGIGRLEGAGKSKEEQRREGARMMYALQRAGEKAMRKA